MKKRIFTIFALMLVVAMMATALVGCSFFRENDYRVANETYVTVKHPNGVTLNVSYNEILDYCNGSSRLYSYVQYYGLSVGEALDLCIEGKIQSTYILADAMGTLTDASKTSQNRINALYGKGAKAKAEDVLTYAERYAAIFAVNDSIDNALETNKETARAEDWSRAYKKISQENVEEIVLTEATLTYLDKFFANGEGCLIGADLDESKVVAKVIYEDGSESAEFVVPSEGYKTAFSSEKTDNYQERTEEKTFTIKFTEISFDEEGEEVETEIVYDYDYTLVYPRDVKAEAEEKADYSKVTIDEAKVDRYALDADIPAGVKAVAQIRDVYAERDNLVANGGDKYEIEAYRLLIENMEANNRDMAYYYKSQFEAMATTALQEELYKGAEEAFATRTDVDARIIEEFKYLYNNQKNTYHGKNEEESKKAFISQVASTGTGMDTLYYHPAVVDLDEYFFVKQVLFKFDSEVVAFLEDLRHDDEAVEEACKYFMATEKAMASNPNYDVDFDCPLHELKEEGAECAKSEEDEICPSIAYTEEDEISDIITKIEGELKALYAEDKYAEASELFEKYLYTYCDDAGSFNANWGYLVTADKDDNSWVENFTDLAKEIYAYNGKVGNTFTADNKIGVSFTYSLSGNASSDYAGVSIMMVAKTPFAGKDGSEFDISNMSDADILAHLKAQVKGDGTSLYDALKDGILSEDRNLAYSDYVKIVPQDVFERDEENNKITVNKDYKDVIEIKVKKLKKNIYDEYLGK